MIIVIEPDPDHRMRDLKLIVVVKTASVGGPRASTTAMTALVGTTRASAAIIVALAIRALVRAARKCAVRALHRATRKGAVRALGPVERVLARPALLKVGLQISSSLVVRKSSAKLDVRDFFDLFIF